MIMNNDVNELVFYHSEVDKMFKVIKVLMSLDCRYQMCILDDSECYILQIAYDGDLSNGEFQYVDYDHCVKKINKRRND